MALPAYVSGFGAVLAFCKDCEIHPFYVFSDNNRIMRMIIVILQGSYEKG